MSRRRRRRGSGRAPRRRALSQEASFHGFSLEEAQSSLCEGSSHALLCLESLSTDGFMVFEGKTRGKSSKLKTVSVESSEESSSSPKKHVNIFTDNLLLSGKRRWKPSEKVQSAHPRSGFGLFQGAKHRTSPPKRRPPQPVSDEEEAPSLHKCRLDEKLLKALQEDPEKQMAFYRQCQGSFTSKAASSPPPGLLLRPRGESIGHPGGTALVDDGSIAASALHKTRRAASVLSGSIICGICGRIAFFQSVREAHYGGTYSCEDCRSFIRHHIQALETRHGEGASLSCQQGLGHCVVTPTSTLPCEACWLKLCLLGYHLESSVYCQLRSMLPKEVREVSRLQKDNARLPHQGKILEVLNGSSLHQPLFQTFGEVKNSYGDASRSAETSSDSLSDRLPSNWIKKSSKVLSGKRKGEWDVHLITPDRKILKNASELKLYVAKTGSIIDSNVVNFSLPQNKIAHEKKATIIEQSKVLSNMEVEDEIFCDDTSSGSQDCVLSSTMKLPAKRKLSSDRKELDLLSPKVQKSDASDSESVTSSDKVAASDKANVYAKKTGCANGGNTSFSPVFAKKSVATIEGSTSSKSPTSSLEVFAKKSTPLSSSAKSSTVSPKKIPGSDKLQHNIVLNLNTNKDVSESDPSNGTEDSNSLAVSRSRRRDKKLPLKFRDTISVFSMEERYKKPLIEDVKKKEIISNQITENNEISNEKPTKKSRSKRCGSCTGCTTQNCRSCYRCKDMICYGGPGNLRRTCVKRVCSNTSLSKSSSKEKISRVAVEKDNKPDSKETSGLLAKISNFKDASESISDGTIRIIKPIETKGKPKMSYSALIAIALFNLPGRRGTLSMIYDYIMHKFPYYKTVDKSGWQNSIRHNLSLNKCFVRTERTNKDGNGKGSFWIFDPEKVKNGTIKNFEKLMESEELFIESESSKENVSSEAANERLSIGEEIEISSPESAYRDLFESEFKVVTEKTVSLDYWEPYDLEQVMSNGVGVLSVGKSPHEAICFLCGSAGKDSVFIHCCVCCEPFHPFCVDPGDAPNSEDEDEWVCRRCAVCQTCGQPEGKQLKCRLCRHAYHESCLQDYQRKFLKEGHPWVCSHCLKCDSCGKPDVSHYSEGVPLCAFCCTQRSKGSFCPLCKGCYEDDDYESRMMECVQCGAWVHSDCEGLDLEKYEVLGSLPSNIEYVCKCETPDLSNRKLLWKNKYHLVRKEEKEEQQTLLTLRSLTPSSSSSTPSSSCRSADKSMGCPPGNVEEEVSYFESANTHIVDTSEVFPQDEFSLNTF